jgi:2-aminoadipate transaminase
LRREGRTLATYNLSSGPQGYGRLRDFIAGKLKRDAGIACSREDILVVSGSLQALDLINAVFLEKGDTVIVEQETYQGVLSRFARLGVEVVGIPLDNDGMKIDALATALDDLKQRGIVPKFIYTIPTVQNPTGTIMPPERRAALLALARQHGIPIVEDDCYADLIWDRSRPPALYATSEHGGVIHVGSFSKSIGPALRVGYIVAPWEVLSRLLSVKTDGGTGAIEQMVLAEFCEARFADHVATLTRGLRAKLDCLMAAVDEQFGTAAEFVEPRGGIFLWVKLPEQVDSLQLFRAASAAGVAVNPGPEWSVQKTSSKNWIRLCFASLSAEDIRAGVAKLAEVCRAEFGVPQSIANVTRRAV